MSKGRLDYRDTTLVTQAPGVYMRVRLGDCVARMREMSESSVDQVVCDPPYGLRFMNKAFDNLGDGALQRLWHRDWVLEVYRVLRPGGRLQAFCGSRTFHHLAAAMEEAGFISLDVFEGWVYASGFPKSLDISKAIDKMKGAKREVVRVPANIVRNPKSIQGGHHVEGGDRPWMEKARELGYHEAVGNDPVSDPAKLWKGWGTALKPAWEPVLIGTKPCT